MASGKSDTYRETYPVQGAGGRGMKQTYWMCVDCSSIINDLNMHEDNGDYAEFCYGCMSYNTTVVIAYR